ncbi:eukaryotic translation initiation factor 4B isoform X2 [Battus philenor]
MGVIIAEPTTIATTNNWADSVEEENDSYSSYMSRPRAPVVLPSASRAARGGMAVDEESIPRRPPYIAHISNLPYDVEESAIADLFEGLKITNLRLPRESGRLKGYGYVDFEDRESLVSAMNIEDLTVGGRRIRIEVSNNDNDRRMGRSGRSDRDREYDPERTMGDWRSGPRAVPEPQARARTMDRDREKDRERESSTDNKPGGWRDGERQAPAEPARTPYGGRDSYGRDRYGDDRGRERGGFGRDGERGAYGGRDGFRSERDGYGSRDGRGFGGRGFGDRDRDPPPREENKPRERPKLNLLPRTVPRDSEVPIKPADGAPIDDKPEKPKPVPAEKVFGAAKPVDTAAKEREIEERLRKQEEEARRIAEEKERWGRRNDQSGDRRGGARREDRGRDSRSYNRDRRDYSKERDRRDYSKDDRDRRDYSKDNRERPDYSRERRDYSKEDKDRHDHRDDRDRRDYKDDRDARDYRDERDRDYNDSNRRDSRDRERREYSGDRDVRPHSDKGREDSPDNRKVRDDEEHEQNGRDRQSRSRERNDNRDERPLPKLKEQEKPNFVASNKFSFLKDADDGGSD